MARRLRFWKSRAAKASKVQRGWGTLAQDSFFWDCVTTIGFFCVFLDARSILKGLGRVWEGLEKVWGGFWKGFKGGRSFLTSIFTTFVIFVAGFQEIWVGFQDVFQVCVGGCSHTLGQEGFGRNFWRVWEERLEFFFDLGRLGKVAPRKRVN